MYRWIRDYDKGIILEQVTGFELEQDHFNDFYLPDEIVNDEREIEKIKRLHPPTFTNEMIDNIKDDFKKFHGI